MAYDLDIYDFDEERDLKYYDLWLHGAQFATPIYRPLFAQMWYTACQHAVQSAADALSIPTTRGWDWKLRDGHFYLTVILTTDEERKAREPIWRERMAPILDDPWGFWERFKAELKESWDRLSPFNVEKATNSELAYHFWDCWNNHRRVQQIHLLVNMAANQGFLLFQTMCKELTGIAPSDPKFAKLTSGFDNMLFQSNKELAELATRAVELGLEEVFDTLGPEEALSKLEESDAGRHWLNQLREYLKVWGMRAVRLHDFQLTWMEKPSLAVPEIKRMIALGGVHAPDMVRERLVRERENIEKEVLAKIPEEQRNWFKKLMTCAQFAGFWNEDHVYLIEFYSNFLTRRAVMELGRRYVSRGILADPEDMFYLLHHEVLYPHVLGGTCDLRPLVKRRKEEWERNAKIEVPLLCGDPAKLLQSTAADPILAIAIAPPIATPEEVGAVVVGAVGAPGVAEGVARVIMSFDEIDQLQQGEILVTVYTAAPWTPAFSRIKGVVTDVGGALSHTVIVAREYGIPCVASTMEATAKIKTGQRIRVDGDLLRVYVLE